MKCARYLIRSEGGRLPDDLKNALPDYVFEFEGNSGSSASSGAYYSTDKTRELNKQFGDIWHKVGPGVMTE